MVNKTELPENASVEVIRTHLFQRLQEGIPAEEAGILLERLEEAKQHEDPANRELLEVLHQFQHGTQEESDRGFITLQRLAREG